MGFFPAVSPILAGLDRQGSALLGQDWDRRVAEAILGFNAAYGNGNLLQRNRQLIDYGDLSTQAAYVFMYVAGHADFLHSVLNRGREEGAFRGLKKPEIRVTSLGGGPGSDLLALVRILRMIRPNERPQRIRYRVLDKQPNWHEILQTVAASQEGTFDIELVFESVDVTVPAQWRAVSCETDDLLIMNFFVSEVCRLREAASVRGCMEHLLGSLAANSVVAFNDSSFRSCFEYFDSRVAAVGGFVRKVVESERLDAQPDFDEYFRDCMVRFGRTPKLGSSAAFRVLTRR
jgi:hypothetical protein